MSTTTVTMLVGTLLPLLVGLATHRGAPRWFKTVVMLAATATATAIRQVIDQGGVLTEAAFVEWAQTVVVAVASYYGVWDPTIAGRLAPSAGLGGRLAARHSVAADGPVPARSDPSAVAAAAVAEPAADAAAPELGSPPFDLETQAEQQIAQAILGVPTPPLLASGTVEVASQPVAVDQWAPLPADLFSSSTKGTVE